MRGAWIGAAVLALTLTGCMTRPVTRPRIERQEMASYESDVTELAKFINMPELPAGASWKTFDMGEPSSIAIGPSDWGIIAILEYDDEAFSRLRARLAQSKIEGDVYVETTFVEEWFPAPIVESYGDDEEENYLVLNQPRYSPEPFAKSPLTQGYAFIRDRFVFVYLHTQ